MNIKTIRLFIILTAIVVHLASCNKEEIPMASFETRQYQPTIAPYYSTFETIVFVNTSLTSVKYRWDFGNGFLSEEYEPMISYTEPGEYLVSLTAESETGNIDTFNKKVIITERIINNIKLDFSAGVSYEFGAMAEGGWAEGKSYDFIFVLAIGDFAPINRSKIDEVVLVSDTLKDISNSSREVTIFPKQDIAIYMDLINAVDHQDVYKLHLYAIENGESRLVFTNNGFGYTHDNGNGKFAFGYSPPVWITCDYKYN